jgi:NADH:ubiquinone oxidoreductase subunit F (NADH-binding)
VEPRLFAGRPLAAGSEPLTEHLARLGPPSPGRPELMDVLEASGLLGRGGASFPVGRKWQTVAQRGGGDSRVLANGAEGEPLSAKDRTLMALRPHLVLDGALLAADAVGAREVVLYVGGAHHHARAALARALKERTASRHRMPARVRLVIAPDAYVAGEESAAVHFVNDADARPTSIPPRPFERGIAGRPTLVQNVETLAHVALIARFGDAWYRQAGLSRTPGTALVTVHGVAQPGVREIELGARLGDLAASWGVSQAHTRAVLVGGYFGAWLSRGAAWSATLDPLVMRDQGIAYGAGAIWFLSAADCGVAATARIMDFMASQSAAQCGPCVFGLRSISDSLASIAAGRASFTDVDRLRRWGNELVGRGACRHPDGAAGLLASALSVFADEFDAHIRHRRCTATAGGRVA